MRERYFACDKVYGGLKVNAANLNKSRDSVHTALAKGYKSKLAKFEEDLSNLQKSKDELDEKVEKLTQFTNDLTLDVMSLAQTESIRSSVKIEGVAQSNAEQLAKVLQGDKLAMEAMVKANPDHFRDTGRNAMLRKKDALEHLDQLLTKLNAQGYGERMGFKTAQKEVKATLAIVNSVIPTEEEAQASAKKPWLLAAIGAALAFAVVVFFLLRAKGGGSASAPAKTTGLGLGGRRAATPGAARPAVTPVAADAAPSATPTPGRKTPMPGGKTAPRRTGMLGMKPLAKSGSPEADGRRSHQQQSR